MKPIEGPTCAPAAPERQPKDGEGVDVVFRGFRPLYEIEGRAGDDRKARLRANLAIREQDLETYRGEIARHLAEADACGTRDALLRHGRYRLPEVPQLPRGMTEREAKPLQRVHDGFRTETRDALAALGKPLARLEGRRAPLELSGEASVSAKLVANGRHVGFAASLPDGSVSGSAGVPVVAAHVQRGRDGQVEDRIEVGAGSARWTFDGDRLESFAFEHGPAYGRVTGSTVTTGLQASRRVGKEGDAIHAELTVKVGVSVTLLDPLTVRRAISPEDAWALEKAKP
jgi:hypothetical protein